MASERLNLPLVVIVGPTASGKTSLAIEVAKRFNGEIICADSRSIYKGADIATAKPTAEERAVVPHWGLDLVEPSERFSVADFKEYACKKIVEIRSRGHIPFLVGGTGLYIDSIVFDYEFGPKADNKLRKKLQQLDLSELHLFCKKNKIELPENHKNKRYVIRAIEMGGYTRKKLQRPINNCIIVGIATEKDLLRQRIENRADQIFCDEVIKEASILGGKYGWENEAMTSNIYPLIHSFLLNKITIEDAKKRFVTLDWRLAKRQITWLKRNRFIRWLVLDDAKDFLFAQLAKRVVP
jgi:tRNA dimethylallyltransferase